MTPTELAARCETAESSEQRELLVDAYELVFGKEASPWPPGWRWRGPWLRFLAKLDAGAFVDAAIMLIAPEMRDEIEITTLYCVARAGINLNHGPDNGPFYAENVCNCISLALTAAALKARA